MAKHGLVVTSDDDEVADFRQLVARADVGGKESNGSLIAARDDSSIFVGHYEALKACQVFRKQANPTFEISRTFTYISSVIVVVFPRESFRFIFQSRIKNEEVHKDYLAIYVNLWFSLCVKLLW